MDYSAIIKKRNQHLCDLLNQALATEFLTFEQTKLIKGKGVYFIYDEVPDLLYIGMTNRNGKTRIKELTSDFRSHTFNKKFLKQHIENVLELKEELKKFDRNSKKQLIKDKIITREQFSECQKHVNKKIKEKLKFKFFDTNEAESLEQFGISILQPLFNGK